MSKIKTPVALKDVAQVVAARRLCYGAGRRWRQQAGLSVGELAAAIDVDPAALSRWERGLASPRPAAARRWLAALDELRRGLDQSLGVEEPVS